MNKRYSDSRCRHSFLIAVVLNLLILSVAFLFSHMLFGTNDDPDISNLLANANGNGLGHYIAFINILFAKAITLLYEATGNIINWYVLLSVALSFVSLTALCWLIIARAPNAFFGTALAFILLSTLYCNHYIVFQFTQNATLYCTAGVMLTVDSFLRSRERFAISRAILGGLLLILGSLLRFQSLYFALPYLAMYLGYELILNYKQITRSHGLKKFLHSYYIYMFAILFFSLVLVLGFRMMHNAVYASAPELKNYYKENVLRAELLDYGMPDCDANAEALEALGVSAADLKLFWEQNYLDRDVFTREVLEALVSMKPYQSTDFSADILKTYSVSHIIRHTLMFIRDNWNLRWTTLTFIGVLCFLCLSKRRILPLLGTACGTFLMICYFVFLDRIPERIMYSVLAPAFSSAAYLCSAAFSERLAMEGDASSGFRWSRIYTPLSHALLTVMAVVMLISVGKQAAKNDTVGLTDNYDQILALGEQHPDALLLLDRFTNTTIACTSTRSPFQTVAAGSQRNVCIQGGWVCWTPANYGVLENMGIQNPYEAITQGREILLVTRLAPFPMLEYIRSHYHQDIALEALELLPNSDIVVFRLYLPK